MSNRTGLGHVPHRIHGLAPSARSLGFVSLALVNLSAGIGLAAVPAHANGIDLENSDTVEISSYLNDLRQRRSSEVEKIDVLETERSDLEALIEGAEGDFGTVEAQLARATQALNEANGDLSGKFEALAAFRVEQADRYEASEQASERLESVAPEISRGTERIEGLGVEIGRSRRALEEAEQAAAQAQAEAAARSETAPDSTGSADRPGSANAVVRFAYDQLGKPYGFGKSGPEAYDCSGLVMAAYSQSGVSLSRTSQGQWSDTVPISRSELSPGDLVFFYGSGHSSLYIGGNQVIHATKPGDIVKIASIDVMPVSGYRRVRA
ncbi:C40 family peptidase [Glycomyces rutgersensis]|uniref:C40 family peptidase n=1 Tax=Glycomyces rutgersensis TaxID=58115 RepID=A0ABN3FB33_9ACTN